MPQELPPVADTHECERCGMRSASSLWCRDCGRRVCPKCQQSGTAQESEKTCLCESCNQLRKDRISPKSTLNERIVASVVAVLGFIGVLMGLVDLDNWFTWLRPKPKPMVVTLEKDFYFVCNGTVAVEDQQGGVYKVSFQAVGMPSSQTFYGVRSVKTEEMTADQTKLMCGQSPQ